MTKSEKEKMLDGEFYQAFDPELLQARQRAKVLCFQLNQTSPLDTERRQKIVKELLGTGGDNDNNDNNDNDNDNAMIWIESPFHVDYGLQLQVGPNFYANYGCTILDCNLVTIGKNCLLAPHVCISAATHPIDPTLRAAGAEFTAPITIGDNVWIGANATICPGVTIGNNVVVGAGAVVTKDFPDNVVIGGVPAKVLKQIKVEETATEIETETQG
jgi:maltose O-acetyltransferase